MKFKNNNLLAFTLSETLVAMAILGIVSVIVIPALRNATPSKDKIMIRKTVYTTKSILSKMLSDSSIYPDTQGFANTTATTASGTYNKFCYYFRSRLNTNSTLTCPTVSASVGTTHFAKTVDGTDWFINMATVSGFNVTSKLYNTRLIVDINGESKSPNCMVVVGGGTCDSIKPTGYTCYANYTVCKNPDTFAIGVRHDGKIKFINTDNSSTSTTVTQTYIRDILVDSTKVVKD